MSVLGMLLVGPSVFPGLGGGGGETAGVGQIGNGRPSGRARAEEAQAVLRGAELLDLAVGADGLDHRLASGGSEGVGSKPPGGPPPPPGVWRCLGSLKDQPSCSLKRVVPGGETRTPWNFQVPGFRLARIGWGFRN